MVALAWDVPWRRYEGADSDAFVWGMRGFVPLYTGRLSPVMRRSVAVFLSVNAADRDAAVSGQGGAACTL